MKSCINYFFQLLITMKRIKSILATMMLALGIMTITTSCSDEKEEPAIPAAKNIEGIYTGDMTCTVMNSEFKYENITLSVNATDDATVNVIISEFGVPPMKVQSINISGMKVYGNNGAYTLASTEFSGDDNGKKYSGTAHGSFADKTLTFGFNLQYGAMPMPMVLSFIAPKK